MVNFLCRTNLAFLSCLLSDECPHLQDPKLKLILSKIEGLEDYLLFPSKRRLFLLSIGKDFIKSFSAFSASASNLSASFLRGNHARFIALSFIVCVFLSVIEKCYSKNCTKSVDETWFLFKWKKSCNYLFFYSGSFIITFKLLNHFLGVLENYLGNKYKLYL